MISLRRTFSICFRREFEEAEWERLTSCRLVDNKSRHVADAHVVTPVGFLQDLNMISIGVSMMSVVFSRLPIGLLICVRMYSLRCYSGLRLSIDGDSTSL